MKKLFILFWLLPVFAFAQNGVKVTSGATILSHSSGDLLIESGADKKLEVVINGTEELDVSSAGVVTPGPLDLSASGSTLILEDGTAASTCIGTATANGTTAVTTSTTCAETGDYIFISANAADVNTANCWATNIVDGTSFDLDCDAASTTTFNWIIIKGQ